MNLIRNIITGILLTALLSGCENSVRENLIKKFNKECGNLPESNCTLDFKNITTFSWDKMYLFSSWTTSDSIASRLGFIYYGDDVPDDYTRMIFVEDKKVVHEEDFRSFDNYDSSIEFEEAIDSLFKIRPYYLPVSKAKFNVKKYQPKGFYKDCHEYEMTPTEK